MKKIIFLPLFLLMIISTVSAANWQANPYDCPNEYNFVTCPGTKIQCGIEGGIAPYCYEPGSLSPLQNSTSNSGDTYNAAFTGGFILNCEETDSDEPYCDSSPPGGDFWCNRNVTCYTTYHRQTRCIENMWSNETDSSICMDCRTNYFECDGSIEDADGCEHLAGASCGSGTGTKEYNECIDASNANCTSNTNSDCDDDDSDGFRGTCNGANGCEIISGASCGSNTGTYASAQCVGSGGNCTRISDYLDCDDDDSDSNLITCNGANGCEVDDGGTCTVGALVGTYSGCTCVVDKSYFETGTYTEYQTNSSQLGMLWFKDYYSSATLINATNWQNESWILNATGCITWMDGTATCTNPTGGADNTSWNESWADTQYADISVTGDNVSWNESWADTQYADISVTGDNTSWNETWADSQYTYSAGEGLNLTGTTFAVCPNCITDNMLYSSVYDLFVNITGDNMTGNLNMSGNSIYGIEDLHVDDLYSYEQGEIIVRDTNLTIRTAGGSPYLIFNDPIGTGDLGLISKIGMFENQYNILTFNAVGPLITLHGNLRFDEYTSCTALETDGDGDLSCGTNVFIKNATASGYHGNFSVVNTSRLDVGSISITDDIDDSHIEGDLNTYVDIAGDTMTGELNITSGNLNVSEGNVSISEDHFICLSGDCSQYITYNGSAIIIQS